MEGMVGLPPWGWVGFGIGLFALGAWRDLPLVRALGVGAVFAGVAAWALAEANPWQQLALWLGLSLLSWIGGKRIARLQAAAPNTHRRGLALVGRAGTAARTFRHGHGTVVVGGETYAATSRDDLTEGAPVRVVGLDDEALRVRRAPERLAD